MSKGKILILSLFCAKLLSAQNLVPNPGFETNTPSCITLPDQLIRAVPWDRGYLTPDGFNTCGPTPLAPYTSATGAARITANSGSGMMGMFGFTPNSASEVEFATIQLSSPMIANTQYMVSFFARVANLAKFTRTMDRIGCCFASTSMIGVNFNTVVATPQVVTPTGSFFSTTWTQYSMVFTTPAAGPALEYMTVGNFNFRTSTTSTAILASIGTPSSTTSSYVFFDDFVVTSTILLPVELLDFSATCLNNSSIQLTWKTASETNNKEFEIEKSIDGINFFKINSVPGNNNSIQTRNYQLNDEGYDFEISSIIYYRLKQIDYSGEFNYSKIIYVDACTDKKNNLEIFPNPTNGILYIKNRNKIKFIKVLNLVSEIIISKNTESAIEILDISNLSNGIYMLLITDENGKITKKKIVKF